MTISKRLISENDVMKHVKIISLLLAFCLVFAFAACGKRDTDGGGEKTAASAQSSEAEVQTSENGTQSSESVTQHSEKTAADDDEESAVEMLAVYFPYDELSEKTAQTVADLTGAKMFALETVNGYSDSGEERAIQAKREAAEKTRPALKNRLETITPYNILFVCAPLWENDLPMAVYTFFEDYDMRDRVIVPICTSDVENSAAAFTELVREKLDASLVMDGMSVVGAESDSASVKTFVESVLNG